MLAKLYSQTGICEVQAIFQKYLIVQAKHKGTKSQNHQEFFESSSLCGFVVDQYSFF